MERGGGGAAEEFAEGKGEDGGVGAGKVGVVLGGGLDGEVGGGEGGDVVLVGVGGGDFVLASVAEQEVEVAGGAGGDERLVRGGDPRGGGLGEVGDEDVPPEGGAGAGADVLDIEDDVFEVFVEDAGLDFEGGLGVFEGIFEFEQGCGGAWGEVEGVGEAEGERAERDQGDDADEVECAHAGGAHGGDFGVGGEAG